jgi:UDP:flavonoid glycosyltransferase YjiC (YdhE family)
VEAALRDAVREVLGSFRYAENAVRVSHQLRQYGGAEAAARMIEDFSARTLFTVAARERRRSLFAE